MKSSTTPRSSAAAQLANLHDEIMAMADGYDTSVGERGGQLSGGQRQRLSIARALAEEPDRDRARRAHQLARRAVRGAHPRDAARAGQETTVVVIAHRLSTLDICDRIMVVHEGEIQGFDTPERLEATNPFYREALELSGLR